MDWYTDARQMRCDWINVTGTFLKNRYISHQEIKMGALKPAIPVHLGYNLTALKPQLDELMSGDSETKQGTGHYLN